MLPRGQLDIGWADLGVALLACARPGRRATAQARAEEAWSSDDAALCALSVRSGFDTLLTALDLPAGGEVLTSALTIEDMPRIMAEHGLVPVPVDLDMRTLTVSTETLERAVGPRTCAVLVAHLFGSRMPLDDVAAFAHDHGLLLIEDCAQAYTGDGYTGHPGGDVAMFSFGAIKTNTALGGAVLQVRDRALLESMRRIQAGQPVQDRGTFLRKVVKYAAIKVVSQPPAYGVLALACRRAGTDHDTVISRALRGFSGPDFFVRIRQQPSYPLLVLLARRLRTFDRRRVERRTRIAEETLSGMPPGARVGSRANDHTHWIFPVLSAAPDRLTRHLWGHGFDATRGRTSLAIVPEPPDRPAPAPVQATAYLSQVVYLPVHAGAGSRRLARLCRAVTQFESPSAG